MRLACLIALPFLATSLCTGLAVAADGFASLAAVDGQARRIYPSNPVEVIATRADTAGQLGLVMHYDQPASGSGKDTVTDTASAETLIVISGRYQLFVGDTVYEGGPGTTVVVPAGIKHGWLNTGDGVGRLMAVFTPGGGEQDLIDWDASNTPSPARKAAIDKAYGITPVAK